MTPVIRSLSRFLKARKGAALVEFSLLAPILILLMCGLAEFANALRQYHVMEKGVRDAGRYLTRVAMTGCAPDANAVAVARNLALTGNAAGGAFLLDNWTDPSTVTVVVADCVSNVPRVYRGHDQLPVIEVTASAPYQDLGMLSVIGVGPIGLEVSHQQLWIGY